MDLSTGLRRLAELAATASEAAPYEAALFSLLQRHVGFDIAFVRRASGRGAFSGGLDRKVLARAEPLWGRFVEETGALRAEAARSGRGVVADVDVFGPARIERLAYYRALMKPHDGRSTALAYLTLRGAPLATLVLGRTTPRFTATELDLVRAMAPTVTLAEAAWACPLSAPAELRHGAARLSPREREILGYLELGYTNLQIATALGTAPRTVRNQLTAVYDKLGVATRAEAVSAAFRLGLLR